MATAKVHGLMDFYNSYMKPNPELEDRLKIKENLKFSIPVQPLIKS